MRYVGIIPYNNDIYIENKIKNSFKLSGDRYLGTKKRNVINLYKNISGR